MQGKPWRALGESILDKEYAVKMLPRAYRDMDEIYSYIAEKLQERKTAENLVDTLEEGIFSLEKFPYRGAERRVGSYAYRGYRQLFVKNFTIVYRVDEAAAQVIIVTVRYSRSQF